MTKEGVPERHKCGSKKRVVTEIETCGGCGAMTRTTPLVDGERPPPGGRSR